VVQQTAQAPVRAVRLGLRRRLSALVLAAAVVLSVVCAMVLLGAWRNDAAIDARTGRTTAEVLSVSFARTLIRFTTPDGAVHSPQRGVLYPRGLEPGQLIRVEYDTANPDLVRVETRDYRLGVLPLVITVLGVWLVLGPLALWLRRSSVLDR
jgi:hypothetical protein